MRSRSLSCCGALIASGQSLSRSQSQHHEQAAQINLLEGCGSPEHTELVVFRGCVERCVDGGLKPGPEPEIIDRLLEFALIANRNVQPRSSQVCRPRFKHMLWRELKKARGRRAPTIEALGKGCEAKPPAQE